MPQVLGSAAAALLAGLLWAGPAWAEGAAPISQATQACLDCHNEATPAIVADWQRGRMARTSLAQALKQPELKRRVSAQQASAALLNVAVGCAECHTLNPKAHADTFSHGDQPVHVVVTSKDCATCHPTEETEYGRNLMSQAHGNLVNNPLYMDLAKQINGAPLVQAGEVKLQPPSAQTEAESCLYCHGTKVEMQGLQKRDTGDYGEMSFPRLSGWPNHGVGRINPDGSKGSCTPCHSRHQFSLALARSPYTCAECHKGPDVPVYRVYQVSKHGNLYFALHKQWQMEAVPWTPGQDFSAPTCAVCHVSLLTDATGKVIVKRSHQMSDRIWVRLLGLIYSHAHPKSPDTSIIKNADGQSLATTLDGRPAAKFLIDAQEQARRQARMKGVCRACHSQQWVDGQMARLAQSIKDADAQVRASTELVQQAWGLGLAQGPAQKQSPFDQYIERVWTEQWLFWANSMRFASAMVGADMGVFEQGRWEASKNVRQMQDWLEAHRKKK
ncbi:MAG: hydroxylamine oxidase [Desulfarculus sp.]|nr:MAG: hydroxylamine oxidase [Desulfarculus sp.]